MLIIRPRPLPRLARERLAQNALTVEVALCVHDALAASLRESGKAVPAAVRGLALIDTGASTTSIDKSAAAALNLTPHGKRWVRTAQGSRRVATYDFAGTLGANTGSPGKTAVAKSRYSAKVMGEDVLRFTCTGLECDLGEVAREGKETLPDDHGASLILLVGMDILSQCVLTVNGPTGFWTLSR